MRSLGWFDGSIWIHLEDRLPEALCTSRNALGLSAVLVVLLAKLRTGLLCRVDRGCRQVTLECSRSGAVPG